jgi:hypothetical protein
MRTRASFLFGVVLLALLAGVYWFLGRDAAAGAPDATPTTYITTTLPAIPTDPPAPPSPTPRPTATPWLDAPFNSHVQPVLKPENTPSPTQVPGTATPPLTPTDPPPPVGPSPAYRDYLPSVWEMVSTPTATISPDATPTIWLTHTPPSP